MCRTASELNVFGPDFQTFILVVPNDGGIKLQKFWQELRAGLAEQFFSFAGGVLKGAVVIAGAFALVARICGASPIAATGTRSLMGSNGMDL